MKITDLLSKDAIKLNGIANSKQDAINKLVDLMAKNGNLTDKEKYTQVVLKRERRRVNRNWRRNCNTTWKNRCSFKTRIISNGNK